MPAIAVVTDAFMVAAGVQAAALGRPDYEAVYVPHPIQDQTPREIEQRAETVAEEIVARLTLK